MPAPAEAGAGTTPEPTHAEPSNQLLKAHLLHLVQQHHRVPHLPRLSCSRMPHLLRPHVEATPVVEAAPELQSEAVTTAAAAAPELQSEVVPVEAAAPAVDEAAPAVPVSYTHLTLPTKRIV